MQRVLFLRVIINKIYYDYMQINVICLYLWVIQRHLLCEKDDGVYCYTDCYVGTVSFTWLRKADGYWYQNSSDVT
jgi:starvation-inducible outer membrane lipoprotein